MLVDGGAPFPLVSSTAAAPKAMLFGVSGRVVNVSDTKASGFDANHAVLQVLYNSVPYDDAAQLSLRLMELGLGFRVLRVQGLGLVAPHTEPESSTPRLGFRVNPKP